MAVNEMELPRVEEIAMYGELPSPTGVALRILDLTRRESTSLTDLAAALKVDPALMGRLLKYANSAALGARRPVVAVEDAIVRLGFRTVGQIALGFSLVSQHRSGSCAMFDYRGFWSRSIAVAVGAQLAARHVNVIAPSEAFTCGLLCGVGGLALASVYPEAYSEVLREAASAPAEVLLHREGERFGVNHDQLSAALVREWGLPDVCVQAIYFHGDPYAMGVGACARHRRLAQVLHFAALMASRCVARGAPDDDGDLYLVEEAHALQLGPERFAGMHDALIAQWRELSAVLDVPAHDVPTLDALAGRIQDACRHLERTERDEVRAAKGLRVLVVDDDPDLLGVIAGLFTDAGHMVTTAQNGVEALHLTLAMHPQMVVTDWVMPEMDGLEFCKMLRSAEKTRRVYLIMLTGCEEEGRLVEAFSAGADDYVVKPVNPRTLMARIAAAQRIIERQEALDRDRDAMRAYAAQLGVVNRKLGQAAFLDSLTLLANRRSGLQRLAQAWNEADATGRPLSCMVIDIDHFKAVNDTHGHDAGDRVLRRTAAILAAGLRQSDTIFRFGGEEFVVICPETDLDGARGVAERLCEAVRANSVRGPGFACCVKVSIGVAMRTADMHGIDDLLKGADGALYAAKRAGRNRVSAAEAVPESPRTHPSQVSWPR